MENDQPRQPASVFRADCLSRSVLELVASTWALLVIYALSDGTNRYAQLLKRIDGISPKMLTQTLRDLERNGLVERVVHPVVPPVVEYSLTPLGQNLYKIVSGLQDWAYGHLGEVAEART